jgi:hypothetical protein
MEFYKFEYHDLEQTMTIPVLRCVCRNRNMMTKRWRNSKAELGDDRIMNEHDTFSKKGSLPQFHIHHRHMSVERRLTDPSKPLPHTSTTREYKCRAYVNIETNPNDPLICSRWHHSYITWNSGRVCYVAEPMAAWHVQLPMDQRMKIKSYLNIRKVRNDKPTIASLEKGTMLCWNVGNVDDLIHTSHHI